MAARRALRLLLQLLAPIHKIGTRINSRDRNFYPLLIRRGRATGVPLSYVSRNPVRAKMKPLSRTPTKQTVLFAALAITLTLYAYFVFDLYWY
jgi:hypothetical protein